VHVYMYYVLKNGSASSWHACMCVFMSVFHAHDMRVGVFYMICVHVCSVHMIYIQVCSVQMICMRVCSVYMICVRVDAVHMICVHRPTMPPLLRLKGVYMICHGTTCMLSQ
jgi:hypothetical protein